jgi:PhzF family phenazine biosynthesis protein
MRIPYFHVDAFASEAFRGNPAGVCVLHQWLSDEVLQKIAAEHNLSETAFFTREQDYYRLRWFTPSMEVDLCGHATLASAFVLFSELRFVGDQIRFESKSGTLMASRRGDLVELDFPSRPPEACPTPPDLVAALGREPREVLRSRDYFAVFDSQAELASLTPDFNLLMKLDCLGIIVTARGSDCDFVSRFFAPRAGIPEDPVTGSAHCSLIPFWSKRLGKLDLFARQMSRRSGELWCRFVGDRVRIGGRAVVYSRGEIELNKL